MNQNERIGSQAEYDALKSEELSAQIRVAMPAIVTRVNLEAQTVEVKLALQGKVLGATGEAEWVNYPILPDVPIIFPRAGGFALTFPVKVDDECLVVFADRCIDAWWQSGGVQKPMDERLHDLSDAFALFGVTSQPRRLQSVASNAVELRDDKRENFISLKAGSLDIKIVGATNVTCDSANVNANSTTVNSPTNQINGDLTVTGLINGQGGLTISGGSGASIEGSLTTTGDVTAGDVSLQGHTHTEQGDGAETSPAH